MSNGAAAWLCKSCKGPDESPWRNWADKERCHKCKLIKKACYLRDAPKGSPSKSVRHARGGGGGGSGGKGSGVSTAQSAVPDAALKKQLESAMLRVAGLESRVQELGGMSTDDTAHTADDDSKGKVLRSEISALEKISGDPAAAALSAKKDELAAFQLAKREAKPLDSRAKDVKRHVEAKRKAADKQSQHVANLEGQLAQMQLDLKAAKVKEGQSKEELAKAEAEKAVILQRVADEAAAGANLATPPQPKVVLQGLSNLFQQMQPAHCQHLGLSLDQVKAFMDMLASMLQVPRPAAGPPPAGIGAAAAGPQQLLPVQPAAAPPPQVVPVPAVPVGSLLLAAASPVGGEDDVDLIAEANQLRELGASAEAIEGWRSVSRSKKGRVGPYGEVP
jgi:hypothetical protein